MNPLLEHWLKMSPDEKRVLAEDTGSTVNSLHQIAHAYRTAGELVVSPDMAKRIEIATGGAVLREEMCPACGACEFVKRCT